MIYIRVDEHAKITRSWHKVNRVKLSSQTSSDKPFLSDIKMSEGSIIEFRNKENVYYDPNIKELLLNYNEEMLRI